MTTICLSWPECEQAAMAGIKRRLLALYDTRPEPYGDLGEVDTWGVDIESAAAELAVARYLGLFWTPWARHPSQVTADVGSDIQVRRCGYKRCHLLLHPRDRDDHRYVLISGAMPDFQLRGWIQGSDGKSPDYWGDPFATGRPAFWVPEISLLPIENLQTVMML